MQSLVAIALAGCIAARAEDYAAAKARAKALVGTHQYREALQLARDLNRCIQPKQMHDIVGHYQRFDVFSLQLNTTPQQPITSYNYENIGVNIDITPRTHHDDDVTLQLKVAVQSISGTGFGGLPTFGNREITTIIRLRDGETNMLAGLIRDEERHSRRKNSVRGRLGAGGKSVRIRTGDGSITLRRS